MGGMAKILYARVPDEAHEYIAERAAAGGVSMGEIVRRLVEAARRIDLTSADAPGNNSRITDNN